MQILVAGGSGMLGHSLVPSLRAAGYSVVSHGSRSGDVVADLTERAAADALLREVAPAVVVNLVGLTNVDACEDRPNEAYRLNTRVAEHLADWARADRTRHLIQISTDQVYDGPGPHAEDNVTITNVYALSKYAGELAALRGPCTVLRTNFFGPSAAGRPSFSDWLEAKFRARETFTGFDDVYFSPLHTATLSRMIALAADRRIGGVFNLGAKTGLSKAEFAAQLARRLGLDAGAMKRGRSADVKLRAYRPSDMRMACTRFETAFGAVLPTLDEEIDLLGDRS